MANLSFSHDDKPPVDRTLEEVGNKAAVMDKPIRVRLQPSLYDWGQTGYLTWHGLTWTIEVEDVAEGRRLREGLTDFCRAFGSDAKRQQRVLRELRKIAAGAR